jgi:uncharacterized integral membrane protein
MNRFKLAALILLSVAVLVVILQNTARIRVALLFTSFEMPLILLLSLTALVGFVIGLLVASLSGRKSSSAKAGDNT